MRDELLVGAIGSALGVVGTATQTNEVLETISLVITILGAIVSFIVVPLLNWYRAAKKDGRITLDELGEAAETLEHGIKQVSEATQGSQQENEDKREQIKKKKGGKND